MDDPGTDVEPQAEADGISRRTLIRLLVGSAIGIPIAIEGRTIIGLIDQHFFGGETHDEPSSDERTVDVGDELLPETTPVEEVTRMLVTAPDDTWTFHLDVAVENTGDEPYEFQIEEVTTTSGTTTGSETTDRIDPGESTTIEATWTIPEGSTPTDLAVTGLSGVLDDQETVERDVSLGNVPVKRRS